MVDATALAVLPDEYRPSWWVFAVLLVVGAGLFAAVCYSGGRGWWLMAGLLALVSSHGLTIIGRVGIDHKSFGAAFDPRTQSWAMLADAFLAVAVALASYGRRYLSPEPWWNWRLTIAYGLGWVLIASRVLWLDWPNYIRVGGEALLYSPAKLLHDFVTYLVLAGAMIYLALPVLTKGLWLQTAIPCLIVGCWLVWVVGMIHDSSGLDIMQLHNAFNWRTWQSEPGFLLTR